MILVDCGPTDRATIIFHAKPGHRNIFESTTSFIPFLQGEDHGDAVLLHSCMSVAGPPKDRFSDDRTFTIKAIYSRIDADGPN
jgi:hypothetical protein